MRTMTPANDNLTWTAATWRAHVAGFHPSHAAASYALHREEMGRLAPSARVITALTMMGKRNARADLDTLDYDRAMQLIDAACAHRVELHQRAAALASLAPSLASTTPANWVLTALPLAAGEG